MKHLPLALSPVPIHVLVRRSKTEIAAIAVEPAKLIWLGANRSYAHNVRADVKTVALRVTLVLGQHKRGRLTRLDSTTTVHFSPTFSCWPRVRFL